MAVMNDASPVTPETGPQGWPHSDAVAHASNTGAEWGRQAASALMLALRTAPETSRESAQNVGAELRRLNSLLTEGHGQAIAEAWSQAARTTIRAEMPDPE